MDPFKSAERYPLAGEKVSGLTVGKDTPDNTESIKASLYNYRVLNGVRAVPLSAFPVKLSGLFYSATDFARVAALANDILESKRIDPLIVVIDAEGPYILEGAHRLGALITLKKKNLPALVVIDEG